MIRLLFITLLPLFCVSCSTQTTSDSPTAESTLSDRTLLLKKLVENKTIDSQRFLAHLSHVCTLSVNNQQLPVIDIRELVKGASSARGINRILILNSTLKTLNQIEYYNYRPLFCKGEKLYLYGDLSIDGMSNEGNIISFDANGTVTDIQSLDSNDWF